MIQNKFGVNDGIVENEGEVLRFHWWVDYPCVQADIYCGKEKLDLEFRIVSLCKK